MKSFFLKMSVLNSVTRKVVTGEPTLLLLTDLPPPDKCSASDEHVGDRKGSTAYRHSQMPVQGV